MSTDDLILTKVEKKEKKLYDTLKPEYKRLVNYFKYMHEVHRMGLENLVDGAYIVSGGKIYRKVDKDKYQQVVLSFNTPIHAPTKYLPMLVFDKICLVVIKSFNNKSIPNQGKTKKILII